MWFAPELHAAVRMIRNAARAFFLAAAANRTVLRIRFPAPIPHSHLPAAARSRSVSGSCRIVSVCGFRSSVEQFGSDGLLQLSGPSGTDLSSEKPGNSCSVMKLLLYLPPLNELGYWFVFILTGGVRPILDRKNDRRRPAVRVESAAVSAVCGPAVRGAARFFSEPLASRADSSASPYD